MVLSPTASHAAWITWTLSRARAVFTFAMILTWVPTARASRSRAFALSGSYSRARISDGCQRLPCGKN
jgi:hypothetical protein